MSLTTFHGRCPTCGYEHRNELPELPDFAVGVPTKEQREFLGKQLAEATKPISHQITSGGAIPEWTDEDKERLSAALEQLKQMRVAKPQEQEPVGYQELFDAIAAATSVACFPGINISIEDFTAKIGPLYTTPQPCQSCAEKQSAIDVWEGRYADLSAKCAELRVEADFNFQQYQDLGEASHHADTLQEARFNQLCQDMDRMTAQRDILQSRIDTTRKFLEFLWRDAQLNDYTSGRLEEILATLNLAAMK